MEQGILF